MRKLAAILLLALFAFNTFGFYLFVAYAKRRADDHLEARLDQGDYDQSELITVKIPLNLPYQTNWQDFERVNGEVNINGVIYNYVQRKVYNDTLILQCIPSIEKTTLQKKANDYFGKVNDLPVNHSNKKTDVFKQFYSFYNNTASNKFINNLKEKSFFNHFVDTPLLSQYLPVNGHPPELVWRT